MLLNFGYKKSITAILSFIFSILLFSISNAQNAQTGSIKGTVVDEITRESLIGANVVVKGTSLGAAVTFEDYFVIKNVEPGERELHISYIGYLTKLVKVNVIAGQTVNIDVELEPEQIDEEGIIDLSYPATGQLAAINEQLSLSTNIIYSAAVEKMTELPADNIPEAIGRMPGISLNRNAGEAKGLIIRGLSPKFNTVSIEGVPLISTGFNDRGIDLSLLDMNLIKRVDVSNTLTPDMDPNSLGGSVNLVLKNTPWDLDYEIKAEGRYNNLRDSYRNFKLAGSITDRILGNNLRVLATGNIELKHIPSELLSVGFNNPLHNSENQGNEITTDLLSLMDNDIERRSYNAGLIFDYFSDHIDIKFFNIYNQQSDSNITRNYISDFANNNLTSDIKINELTTKQRIHTLQASFKLGKIELPISLSYSNTEQSLPNSQQFNFMGTGMPMITYEDRVNKEPSGLLKLQGIQNPENTSLYNLNRMNSKLSDGSYDIKTDLKVHFKLARRYKLNLSAGGKYHDVNRINTNQLIYYDLLNDDSKNRRSNLINAFNFLNGANPNLTQGIESKYFIDNGYYRNSILGYPIGPGYDIYKLSNIMNTIYPDWEKDFIKDNAGGLGLDYDYKEKTYAGYIMGEFNYIDKLIFVAGIRYQKEDFDVSAYHYKNTPLLVDIHNQEILDEPLLKFINAKSTFDAWYPSVNIKYSPLNYLQLQGAVYKSSSLPNFRDMSPFVILQKPMIIETGNPKLKPSTALNFDFRASVYSNEIGLFTAEYFYKEISDLIVNVENYYPSQYFSLENMSSDIKDRLPSEEYYNIMLSDGASWNFVQGYIPMNNPYKTYLRGVEFSWMTSFWYLPRGLDGFVLDLNLTLMSSNQQYPYFFLKNGFSDNPPGALEFMSAPGSLQDQPSVIFNGILGWDYKRFNARLAFKYQMKNLEYIDPGFGQLNNYYDKIYNVNLSLMYQIMSEIWLYASAVNISNNDDEYFFSHPEYTNNSSSGNYMYSSGMLSSGKEKYGWGLQLGIRLSNSWY